VKLDLTPATAITIGLRLMLRGLWSFLTRNTVIVELHPPDWHA
jgi:hypothetical protein